MYNRPPPRREDSSTPTSRLSLPRSLASHEKRSPAILPERLESLTIRRRVRGQSPLVQKVGAGVQVAPGRPLVVVRGVPVQEGRMDGNIRGGGDAGPGPGYVVEDRRPDGVHVPRALRVGDDERPEHPGALQRGVPEDRSCGVGDEVGVPRDTLGG